LQWQWQANPKATWMFLNPSEGLLRLYSDKIPDDAKNYWDVPNMLMQKIPGDEFVATTKLTFKPNFKIQNEKAGVIIMGQSYANLALKSSNKSIDLVYTVCKDAIKGSIENERVLLQVKDGSIYMKLTMMKGAVCRFSYSVDGKSYTDVDENFQAEVGRWIGMKIGLFCTRTSQTNDSGFVDVDWFRIE
jgi:hypothetical protein